MNKQDQRANPLALPMGQHASTREPHIVEHWMAEQLLRVVGKPPMAIKLWNGECVLPADQRASFTLRVNDRKALYELLANPNLAFGDLYSAGRLDMEGDLADCLTELYRYTERQQEQMPTWMRWFVRGQTAPRSAALTSAKKNIHHHYDLGNEFYQLWLDRAAMQ